MKKAMIPGFDAHYLFERGNCNFLYRRRIPEKYRVLADGQLEFKASLKCKNTHEVIEKYGQTHAHFEHQMSKLKAGKSLKSIDFHPAHILRSKATELGVIYKSVEELIKDNDMGDFYKRISLVNELPLLDHITIQAVLGGDPDEPTLQRVLDFYEETTRDELIGKHDRQISRKKGPVRFAVQKFIDFFDNDKSINKITKQDIFKYRSHLVDIVRDEVISANTANKYLMHVRKIISHYIEQHDLNIKNPFLAIRLKEQKGKQPPFSVNYLREKWLTGNPFETMNHEALHAVYAMLDTGTIHSEICGLLPDEIHINDDVPYIDIKDNSFRQLKTDHRGRKIPLIGYALKAFQQYPSGFPKYRTPTGPANLSASVGKFLRENDLKETDKHVLYSLRHAFKDRMRTHEFPPDLQNHLMGHKDPTMGAHYGSGYKLEHTLNYMKKIETDWENI